MIPVINLSFITTGLDDRIVKSWNPAHPKIYKPVEVHTEHGVLWENRPVNVDIPEVGKSPHKSIGESKKPHGIKSSESGFNSPSYQPTQSDIQDFEEFMSDLYGNTKPKPQKKVSSKPPIITLEDAEFERSLGNLSKVGVTINRIKSQYSEDTHLNFFSEMQRKMWQKVRKLLNKPEYDEYLVCGTYSDADHELGGSNFIRRDGKTPGATHYSAYNKKLTDFEYTSILGYTFSHLTHKLNNWLRNIRGTDREGKPLPYPEDEWEVNVVKTMAKHLDSAIEKYDVEKPLVVYRSIRFNAFKSMVKSAKEGVLQDNGFSSTTVVPESFELDDEPVVTLVIKVPTGKGIGAWLKPHSRVELENEFLLARGIQFKIDSLHVTYDKNNKPVTAVAEVAAVGKNPPPLGKLTQDVDYLDYVDECARTSDDEDCIDDDYDYDYDED